MVAAVVPAMMRKPKSAARPTIKSGSQPTGWHTVTPRLVVPDPAALLDFVKTVFAASGELRLDRPTVVRMGDSIIMVSSGAGLRAHRPGFLYVYVPDTDETYRRAIAAHAVSLEEPADLPYGDRRAMFSDPWGNLWQVATPQSRAARSR